MSRIGKKPVEIPAGVKVKHDVGTRTLEVDGPKGKLSFRYTFPVSVEVADGEREVRCTIPEDKLRDGQTKAHWGTTRSRIANMMHGVTTGYERKLEVVGVGWNARMMGKSLQLNVGYCHPVDMPLPAGVECTVENNVITLRGFDKQVIGQFAAEIRDKRRPEPYNGKGIKYSDEVIMRKQGKAFGS